MSSLPANSARATNAVAPSATHVMRFIVGLSLAGRELLPAQTLITCCLIKSTPITFHGHFFRQDRLGSKVGPTRALSLAWPGGSVGQRLTRKIAYADATQDEQLAAPSPGGTGTYPGAQAWQTVTMVPRQWASRAAHGSAC